MRIEVTGFGLLWWGYLGVKLFGSLFAAWSYWWLLLPIVPWLWAAVHFARL